MEKIVFDTELVKRYDGPGPRYTSYPTAVQFHEDFAADDYARLARLSNAKSDMRQLSLYVHIPFCHSLCYYCGCHKIVTRTPGVAAQYLEYVFKEAALHAELYDQDRPVLQLHLGGGTPTYLSDAEMRLLMEGLSRYYPLLSSGDREYSLEIDPRTTGPEMLPLLAELGFNRLSMGIQDFDPQVQRAVNRVQEVDHTLGLIRQARDVGFVSVSVDLIYGLPHQDLDQFEKTLDLIVEARPDRIATYNYAHLPRMFKAQRLIREETLPSAQTKLALLRHIVEYLTDKGYEYIGMDHFALPEDELVTARNEGTLQRNFQGYSTYADCDLIALGVSSIGRLDTCYSQNLKLRKDYYASLDAGQLPVFRGVELGPEDVLRRQVIQGLMCQDVVNMNAIGQRFDIDFRSHFAAELEALRPLEADGLVEVSEDAIRVTARGRFLLRPIAMTFDEYLPAERQSGRFSKVI
ncbi:MAG: oxygen-independent coproporphyrinogen III oxidase [Gammaproteobacteria bacterium]|nr:MAG: oxygen-independent coproporphyrinogen III oxidase [Gammaproteobacteria bacterium]